MSESIQVQITPQQQTLLLDGLSYLRNSTLLECRFPTEESDQDRERQVREIEELAEHLGGSKMSKETASV